MTFVRFPPAAPPPAAARGLALALVRVPALAREFALALALGFALATPAAHAADAPAHDMATMNDGDAMPGMPMKHPMAMHSAFGPYAMSRDGSGTSWQPDATPMGGLHLMQGEWMLMAHGFVNAVEDRQSGPRGAEKAFTESMFMLMGSRPVGSGTLGLRAMASLDPTMGKRGYPLLGQTGETADGRTALVDRQHPHDLLMELSTSYSVPFDMPFETPFTTPLDASPAASGAAFVYVGLPGEPALGPPAFMHRASGMRIPEAPLTHHWLDSTHITFGVATLGASVGPLQLEGSWFNGRELDQFRWNIETRRFDAWSMRLSYNPTPALAMQVSYGDLKSPEQLEPEVRVRRSTASISYQRNGDDSQWATTLAWGRNRKTAPGLNRSEPGWLLESTFTLRDTHTVFARAEQLDNSELIAHGAPLHGTPFRIRKLSVGYIFDVAKTGPVRWGVGGLLGWLSVPSALEPDYGSSPRSAMVFLQGRL